MLKALLVMAAALMLTACDPTKSSSAKSVRAVQSWAANDYVSCRDTTLEIILAAQAEKSEDFEARGLHGWCLLALGRIQEADKVFTALRSFQPNNFQALLGDAWIRLQLRQLDAAEEALEKSGRWATAPLRTPQQVAEGWLAFYRGDFEKAKGKFRDAHRDLYYENYVYYLIDYGVKRNWATQPWVGLGWVAMYEGKPEAARKAFLEGLELDPNCNKCYGGLARLYMSLGDRQRAFNFAAKGLALTRHDPGLISFVNEILFDEKNPRLSVALYEKLVEQSNGDPHYLANLGYARYYAGDLNGAALAFESALEIDPREALALGGKAFVGCLQAGKTYLQCTTQ